MAESADLVVLLIDPALADSVPAGIATTEEVTALAEDAFLLRTGELNGQPVLLAAGGGIAGVIHAINELGMHRLIGQDDILELPALDVHQSSALPYRLLWTWITAPIGIWNKSACKRLEP